MDGGRSGGPSWARLAITGSLFALLVASCSGGKAETSFARSGSSRGSSAPTSSTALGPPAPTPDPAGLASQLSVTEGLIRDPGTSPAALDRAGWLEELDYAELAAHPAWSQTVVPHLPAWLQPKAGSILDARLQQAALANQSSRTPTLPRWRIVMPAPASQLLADYQTAAAATGVPWEYLAAVNLIETYMGRVRGTSTAGAQGPMQFLPSTWASYGQGGDINSDHDAILAAGRLLRAAGAPSRMATALYRYNPSQHYVQAVTDYADVMRADPRSYFGFYGWQVYYPTDHGDVLLPVGYGQ